MDRRRLLKSSLALGLGALIAGPDGQAAPLLTVGRRRRFDFARLQAMAKARAARPYVSRHGQLPPAVADLDWDQYKSISFQHDQALWRGDGLEFRVEFFHLGLYFKDPVRIYQLVDGEATEIAYDPAMFDYGKSGLGGKHLSRDLGFAGFRLFFDGDWTRDVTSFLGASYFRAVGQTMQYGLSARGLAIDTGLPKPEEFPIFEAFWLEKPKPGAKTLQVYALLDSPSIAGAYHFAITPGDEQRMEVHATLYPRKAIERLGIAPETSMYWCGENQKLACDDFRPQIHDSDGLAMHTGAGEWIWRPLDNPDTLRVYSFLDENPKGFGLEQRDRRFADYEDDGAWYNLRPGLWVEPLEGWGKGAVQLVEIPTRDETFDNIVAFWNPARKTAAGQTWQIGYRLWWGSRPPDRSPLARVVATRTGAGGVIGQKHDHYSRRFVVDFKGDGIEKIPADSGVEPVITVSRGRVERPSARPLLDAPGHAVGYRVMFDLNPLGPSTDPIDLRMFLRRDGKPLSETWMYEWAPPPLALRNP